MFGMTGTLAKETAEKIKAQRSEQNNSQPSSSIEIEKKINHYRIPKIIIDQYAPKLDEASLEALKAQWIKFWELRGRFVFNVETESTPTIKSGDLIHNMMSSPEILKSILNSGIISGEIGFDNKSTTSEDMETHYCADFFINKENRSIKDFTSYIYQKDKVGITMVSKGERYNYPFKRRDEEIITNTPGCISIVLDGNNSELKDLLSLSGTSSNSENISKFIRNFPRSDDRHLAVVVGVPANFIKYIIVSPDILADQERLQEIKNIISEARLKITITDSDGNVY
jgi:hypothetical protein